MIIVALCGSKGSGKDTAAKLLTSIALKANYKPSLIRFNDLVNECLYDAFQLEDADQFDQFLNSGVYFQNKFISGKLIADTIQTHIRQSNDGAFIEHAYQSIKRFDENEKHFIIIPDLMFKKEVIWCKENKVNIIKIKKNDARSNPLISEREIGDFLCDLIVRNDKEKEDLEKSLLEIFVRLRACDLKD